MSVTPPLEQIGFPDIWGYKSIAANSFDTVFYMPISGGYVGFIKTVFIKCPLVGSTWLEFIVDGTPVEGGKIEHDYGSLDSPVKFDPPILVRNWIRVIGHNDSSSAQDFEAMINGILVKPKT